MKRMVAIVILGFLTACGGGSPTQPTPAPTSGSTVQTGPTSAPPADPAPAPTPTPAPPTPAPSPAPAPTPAPTRTVLHATVNHAFWYPNASFTLPQRFDIVIQDGKATIATLAPLPFSYYVSADEFLVRTSDFELSVQGGMFAFNGLSGNASGPVARD